MKKIVFILLLGIMLLISEGIMGVSADTFSETTYIYEEYNDSTTWSQLIFIDDENDNGTERNYINGYIEESGDVDTYYFVLQEFSTLRLYFTYGGSSYNIELIQYYNENGAPLDEVVISESQLYSGVDLVPGHYTIRVSGDYSYNYSASSKYYMTAITDADGWDEESFNVFDEVVNNTRAVVWTNQYAPDKEVCFQVTGCYLYRYYSDSYGEIDYLYKRLYALDREFIIYLHSMFMLIADEVNGNYEDYENLTSYNELVTDALIKIAGTSEDPAAKAATYALKAEQYVFNYIALEVQTDQTIVFLDETYYDTDEVKVKYREVVSEYYDEQIVTDVLVSLFETEPYDEVMDSLNNIATTLNSQIKNLDSDDYLYIDFYNSLWSNGAMYSLPYRIYYGSDNNIPGSNDSNAGNYYNLFKDGSIEISNIVNGDYGVFDKFEGTDTLPTASPVIHFYRDEYMNNPSPSNYNNDDLVKLIEMNSPTAVADLEFGLTAFDINSGFMRAHLNDHEGFSQYGEFVAEFRVDGDSGDSDKSMWYVIFNWADQYEYQEYSFEGTDWQYDGSGTAYSKYPHDTIYDVAPDNSEQVIYRPTGSPEYNYRETELRYYDKVCFQIYKRSSGWFGIPTDSYKGEECYYINTLPSTSDDADYFDYKTYYTSSSETSTATQYISNYWYVSNIDGATKLVYMNDRNGVSDGQYFVKYTSYAYNNAKKYVSDSMIGWNTYQSSGADGDMYYRYSAVYTWYTDYTGTSVYYYKRYPCTFDNYFNFGNWVTKSTDYYVTPPPNADRIRYVKTSEPAIRVFD